MKECLKVSRIMSSRLQVLIGLATLLLGSLVYLIDRPPDQTYFVYRIINIDLHNILPNLFGLVGNSLPAFIHPFSFILITAGLISCEKRGYLIICLSWFIINSAFELGQKYNTWSASVIPNWFAGVPFLESTESYFLCGIFDYTDLAAIVLGTVISYFVLLTTNKRSKAL